MRNINNNFISKILNLFTILYNTEHNILPSEYQEPVYIHIKRDLFIFDFNYQNFINSYDSLSIKGSQLENQDNYFFYNYYFLIKNLTFFCVLDGHGKNGKEVFKYISILFPSYLFNLLSDNNLSERKLEINKEIIKLIKLEESIINIK